MAEEINTDTLFDNVRVEVSIEKRKTNTNIIQSFLVGVMSITAMPVYLHSEVQRLLMKPVSAIPMSLRHPQEELL